MISDMAYDYAGIMELRAKMIEYRNEYWEKAVTLSHVIGLLGEMARERDAGLRGNGDTESKEK